MSSNLANVKDFRGATLLLEITKLILIFPSLVTYLKYATVTAPMPLDWHPQKHDGKSH